MNDTPLPSTLREMRSLLRDSRSWIVLAVLSLIAGLVGPFGTYEAIGLLPRLAYWTVVVVTTAAAGTLVAGMAERRLRPHMSPWLAASIAGAAAGPVVTALVALLNWGTFGRNGTVIELSTLLAYCTVISIAVTVLSAALGPRPAPPAYPIAAGAGEAALLDRLARPQRGRLLHIAVSDHYVDVATDRGTSLVLMRLSDAIRETAPVPGLQVHRSHWVALDAVRRSRRQGGKLLLELENGTLVPVSRTYLEAVRRAGLA